MTRDCADPLNRSAHLLRFGAALTILIAVSLAGVALEQRSLEFSRRCSLQTFRADRLEREAAELRLKIERLQTPRRLMEARAASGEAAGSNPVDAVRQTRSRR